MIAENPFDSIEGPREVLVEIHVDYEDDHPRILSDQFLGTGVTMDGETFVSRDDRGMQRRIRITTPDLVTWRRAQAILASTPGLTVLAENDTVALKHRGGKIEVVSRVSLLDRRDFEAAHVPGVARVALAIAKKPALAWHWTTVGRSVVIVGNGTRVLELGALGPLANLPSMEAIAAMYNHLGGVSAIPMVVSEIDVARVVDAITAISANFGAIHLDDIQSPDCFGIEDALRRRTGKLVYHDARHGTAIAVLATLLRLTRHLKLDLTGCEVGVLGVGVAGTGIVQLLDAAGVTQLRVHDPSHAALARIRDTCAVPVDPDVLMSRSKIVIAATGRAGLIAPASIRSGQIILSLSKPLPEISIEAALRAGAAFASDARAVNNVLVYPGLVRALLEMRSHVLTNELMLVAARALAAHQPGGDLPDAFDLRVHSAMMQAVFATRIAP